MRHSIETLSFAALNDIAALCPAFDAANNLVSGDPAHAGNEFTAICYAIRDDATSLTISDIEFAYLYEPDTGTFTTFDNVADMLPHITAHRFGYFLSYAADANATLLIHIVTAA